MDIIQKITDSLKVRRGQVEAAVKLIDEGNTIPFIARYRKEATGSLNDEQLRSSPNSSLIFARSKRRRHRSSLRFRNRENSRMNSERR